MIPVGVTLFVYFASGEACLTVPEGVTLTVNGKLTFFTNESSANNASLAIAGTVVNNGEVLVDGGHSSISLTDNGAFRGAEVL